MRVGVQDSNGEPVTSVTQSPSMKPYTGLPSTASRHQVVMASPGIPLRRRDRGAAVDDERVAGDVARVVGQEEAHGVADVPAAALAFEHRRVLAQLARR